MKDEPRQTRLTVRLPESAAAELRQRAKVNRRSLNSEIVCGLESYLGTNDLLFTKMESVRKEAVRDEKQR